MPNHHDCPFCGILRGEEPGTIIVRDDSKGFAIIKSIHPESVVHWLAMPIEHVDSTEAFEHDNEQRFVQLFEWAVVQTKKTRRERALPRTRLYPQDALWFVRNRSARQDPHFGDGIAGIH